MAKATRQQTTAVAGYDLTFTPVKSVSTLWALADRDVAKQIQDAHHAAVEATLTWLEDEVLFTRRGRGGIQQVKAKGLIAGMFTHRDARSADPHLHTHVAVSNKVQDLDGHWLAVDGRVLYKANVTLSEMYNTLLEAELIARLGVKFENRRHRSSGLTKGVGTVGDKRPVREIVGVDERLAKAWSKRDSAIEARRRELAAAFQAEHGRPPTHGEAVTLKEQAWGQTRQAKHAPRSHGRPTRRLACRGHHRSGRRASRTGHGRDLPRAHPGRTGGHRRVGHRDGAARRGAGRRGPGDLAGLAPARRSPAPGTRPRHPTRRPRRRRRPCRRRCDRRPLHRLQWPRPAHPRRHRGRARRDDSRRLAAHRDAARYRR